MSDLKPCPFCGGKAEYGNDTGPGDEGFWEWIGCTVCGAKADDAAAWNRRAEPKAPDAAEVVVLRTIFSRHDKVWTDAREGRLTYEVARKTLDTINAEMAQLAMIQAAEQEGRA